MAELDREFEYYKANKDSLVSQYEGKFIVIVGHKVIGAFDDRMEAIKNARKDHELGTFLVQHVKKEDDVAFFHSRVSFKNA